MGHLPTRSNCPEHWTVHDAGRGARRRGQFAMVRGVLPRLAEGRRSHAWRAMAVAEGEGVGGKSFPISEGILGGNRRRTRHLLYKTAGSSHQGVCSGGGRRALSHMQSPS